MSRDEFMREFSRCKSIDGEIDLPREILDNREEFLFALYETLHGHLTVDELNQAYIILARLVLGKYPKIAAIVPSHDRVRVPYVSMEYLPQVKGKLTSQERLLFAFSVFYSVCIEVYEEDTDQILKGITELTSKQKIMDLMFDDMDRHPERYEFFSPENKTKHEESSAPFATSKENPIRTINIQSSYFYLSSLRTRDGMPVHYNRIGSMRGKTGRIIDGYTLTFIEGITKKGMTVYIDPYSTENSKQAPEGLTLADSYGANNEEDYYDELDELIEAAEGGDGRAQFKLGIMYYYGKGVEQDYSKAFKWCYMAAEQGYSDAQTNVGMMYSKGQGVAQDYAKALKWYKLAADKGNAEALGDLGIMYENGQGVKRDIEEAVKFYSSAAEKGNAEAREALIRLGRL